MPNHFIVAVVLYLARSLIHIPDLLLYTINFRVHRRTVELQNNILSSRTFVNILDQLASECNWLMAYQVLRLLKHKQKELRRR